MDFEYAPALNVSKGIRPLTNSGCNLALLLAYKNLKQRYITQSKELKAFKPGTMENAEGLNSSQAVGKNVEQLRKLLETKTTAYNNLVATCKEMRENDEYLVKHSTEMEQMLYNVMDKCQNYQLDIQQLKEKFNDLELENVQLKEKLAEKEKASIPEVSVLKTEINLMSDANNLSEKEVGITNIDKECIIMNPEKENITLNPEKQLRQVKALLYENKSLKTNMYWLTNELKTIKSREGMLQRLRQDSGGLEEGRACERSANEEKRKDMCKCMKNTLSYVRRLEQTVLTLKVALDKNNAIINDMLLKKYGHVPKVVRSSDALGVAKLVESYVTINGGDDISPEMFSSTELQDEESYHLPELESASVIVPLDSLTSEDDIDNGQENGMPDMNEEDFTLCDQHTVPNVTYRKINSPDLYLPLNTEPIIAEADISRQEIVQLGDEKQSGDEKKDPLNDSQGETFLRNINCPCTLPNSLIRNLEQYQTKTYLTSKKSNETGNGTSEKLFRSPEDESPIGSPLNAQNVLVMFEKKNRPLCPLNM